VREREMKRARGGERTSRFTTLSATSPRSSPPLTLTLSLPLTLSHTHSLISLFRSRISAHTKIHRPLALAYLSLSLSISLSLALISLALSPTSHRSSRSLTSFSHSLICISLSLTLIFLSTVPSSGYGISKTVKALALSQMLLEYFMLFLLCSAVVTNMLTLQVNNTQVASNEAHT